MTDYLISYDLNTERGSPHKDFLTQAETEGLLYIWKGVTWVNRLPNTTLWGQFASRQEANKAFDRARAKTEKKVGYKVVVEKRATTAFDDASVLSDIRTAPEPKWTGATTFETSRLHQLHDPFF